MCLIIHVMWVILCSGIIHIYGLNYNKLILIYSMIIYVLGRKEIWPRHNAITPMWLGWEVLFLQAAFGGTQQPKTLSGKVL